MNILFIEKKNKYCCIYACKFKKCKKDTELLQNQGSAPPASDGKSDNNKHFSAKSALGGLPNAQTLLQQPPLQVLVIERMHSGLSSH